MNSNVLSNELKKLTNQHVKNLLTFQQSLLNNQSNQAIREHFEYLKNSYDSNETERNELKRNNSGILNEPTPQQNNSSKRFESNWNIEYCERCKLSYWPSNCTVYILPKFHMTTYNSKLYTKHRLNLYRPKYKSYKDKFIKNTLNKGVRLIYECKRCKFRNVIMKELKRKEVRQIVNKSKDSVQQIANFDQFKLISYKKIQHTDLQVEKVQFTKSSVKRKFQSLQTKLLKNEIEQQNKKKNSNSGANLGDFLQSLIK